MITGYQNEAFLFTLLIALMFPAIGWPDESDGNTSGKTIYDRECQTCHGVNGSGPDTNWRKPLEGQGLLYPPPPLDHSAHAWHHPDRVLKEIILNGGKDGRMPSFRKKLTMKEMNTVIKYLHSLWKQEQLEWQQKLSNKQQIR